MVKAHRMMTKAHRIMINVPHITVDLPRKKLFIHFDVPYSCVSGIDLIPDSDAILKILSVDFCGKLKVNSDS